MTICSGYFFPLLRSDFLRRYRHSARLNPVEKNNGEILDAILVLTEGQHFLAMAACDLCVEIPDERWHCSLTGLTVFLPWYATLYFLQRFVYQLPLCSEPEKPPMTISPVPTKELPDANGMWLL